MNADGSISQFGFSPPIYFFRQGALCHLFSSWSSSMMSHAFERRRSPPFPAGLSRGFQGSGGMWPAQLNRDVAAFLASRNARLFAHEVNISRHLRMIASMTCQTLVQVWTRVDQVVAHEGVTLEITRRVSGSPLFEDDMPEFCPQAQGQLAVSESKPENLSYGRVPSGSSQQAKSVLSAHHHVRFCQHFQQCMVYLGHTWGTLYINCRGGGGLTHLRQWLMSVWFLGNKS